MLYMPEKSTVHKGFVREFTFSGIDLYLIIIVQHPELKCDATHVQINETRYLSCLSVAPLMDAIYI